MIFFEESRMSKCSGGHCIFGEFVADIWSAKTIANAKVLGSLAQCTLLLLHSIHPAGNSDVGESCVLGLPGFIIKIWLGFVVTIFTMLPNGILSQMC